MGSVVHFATWHFDRTLKRSRFASIHSTSYPAPVRWIFPQPLDESVVATLAKELAVPTVTAALLARRGLAEPAAAAAFLDPRLKTLRDPFEIIDMEPAIARLMAAIERQERIVFYGDYDVDGVSSLALLTRVLRASGADPRCFLPNRFDEGYGLSADGIARCLEEHQPQLLIAVDCGTTSVAEIAGLRANGVDVIVLDHHEPAAELPDCLALVNPKRGTSNRDLCSAGLAFKFAHALLKRRPVPSFDLRDVLDLAALGTVADLVPLLGENRILVKHGLQRLASSRWPGVRALVEVAGLRPPFGAGHVGFALGPRLNAAGRLGTALDALNLLLTDDPAVARTLASGLDAQNRERRTVEDRVCTEAETQIASWFDPEKHAAIVAGSADWHSGVIGIVASRIARRHHRPTIIVSFDEAGSGKGSGRSISGFSLVSALTHCRDHLEKYGGHELAAGLSISKDRFEAFRDSFLTLARQEISADQLVPRLHVDAELPLRSIDLDFLTHVENLAPFGIGHRQPVFFTRHVSPRSEPRLLKEKHISFLLTQHGWESRAIWFGATQPLPEPPWDIAFELSRNEYLGHVSAQVQIVALRRAIS